MAQKAKKDRAKSNAAALNNLHIGAAVVNGLFLAWSCLFRSRSLLAYALLSLPSFICQFALEKAGRPKFDAATGALKSSGEDLAAQGLTEYLWDVCWVTWGVQVLVMLFGNWLWLVWSVVPAYGAYKGYGLLGMAKGLSGMQGMQQGMEGQQAAPAPSNRKQRRAA